MKTSQRPKAASPQDAQPINPSHFYRKADGPKFFGYGHSVLDDKIAAGDIPTPVALSDGGRARGWFGDTIIAWQAERKAKAADQAWVAARKAKEMAKREAARKKARKSQQGAAS